MGAALAVLLVTALGGSAAQAARTPVTADRGAAVDTVTYLALGDSLAVGYQPGRGKTAQGYVDVLWERMREQIPTLGLRKVGCAGETSYSMISGRHSPCHYKAGSQLNAAVSYVTAHPGQVAFITIDIGANDLINRCLAPNTGLINSDCASDMFPRLQARLTRITEALHTAAPGVPVVAMTYYDPFLGLWGLVPGGRALARADQRVLAALNAALATVYQNDGVTVADVATTFRISDFTHTVLVPGRGRIPVNVALTCRWTWFCSTKYFGDPHPNRTGYRKIARTFERALQGLLQ